MMTLNTLFQETVAAHGAKTALMARSKEGKSWDEISYATLAARVAALASVLAARGIQKGDRVALMSENQPAWPTIDLAVLSLGAILVPIYPTLPPAQIAYIVNNSGAKAIFAGDAKTLTKILEARETCPELMWVASVSGSEAHDGVLSYDALLAEGVGQTPPQAAVSPDDVASLVYTSGTTGDPKGAMLTHGNLTSNVNGALEFFNTEGGGLDHNDVLLSFLPLSHIFERMAGYYLAMRIGATIAYSEGVRGLATELTEIRPTLMFCVPRVWEAFMGRAYEKAEKSGKAGAFAKAIAVGKEVAQKRLAGERVNPILAAEHALFDKLVYGKAREAFGGRMRYLVSGGAALPTEINWFYLAIGIDLVQGYGMTETSPVISINSPRRNRVGTTGMPLKSVEVKIAPDGEICARGASIMKGYWENEQATREMIDEDGWLHTGDIGALEDGYLKITDRKKDIIVLANGKNVAPQPIEGKLKQSPFIADIVLIGDKQSTVSALVIPNKEKLREWASAEKLSFADDAALCSAPEVKKKLKSEIDTHSTTLADFEKVKRFTILNAVFSIETGELTPSLKIKRKVIVERYAKEIAELRGDE